jgi:hypothetical protein
MGGDAKHAMKFDSFEESERAERAYYRSLSPQDRLNILLEIVARHEDARGEAGQGLARVCRVAELPRS